MKDLLFVTALLFSISPFLANAENATQKKCDEENYCVDNKNFTAEVKRVRKRGDIILLQVKYDFKKSSYSEYYIAFKEASLIDSTGNEVVVKDIETFTKIRLGDKRNMSLKFKAEGFKWDNTFDLEIRGDNKHGSIAFFDLKAN